MSRFAPDSGLRFLGRPRGRLCGSAVEGVGSELTSGGDTVLFLSSLSILGGTKATGRGLGISFGGRSSSVRGGISASISPTTWGPAIFSSMEI